MDYPPVRPDSELFESEAERWALMIEYGLTAAEVRFLRASGLI